MNKAAAADRLMRFEEQADYMYRGADGAVIVGVGHELTTAQEALGVRWHGSPPNDLILADWKRIWSAPRGLPCQRYAGLTMVRLSAESIPEMLDSDIGRCAAATAIAVPQFVAYPEPAQEALLDLAWTLGIAGLLKQKVALLEACRAGDWMTAALESGRREVSEIRNAEICALLANAGLPPSKGLATERQKVIKSKPPG